MPSHRRAFLCTRPTTRPVLAAGAAGLVLSLGLLGCTTADEPDPTPVAETEQAESEQQDQSGEEPTEEPTDPWVTGTPEETPSQDPAALLDEAPAVESWEDVVGLEAPVSAEHGPSQQDGPLWTGYEHSAEGAVLAAHYVFAAQGNVPGYAQAWIPDSELREMVLEQEQTDPEPVPTLVIAGFRNVTYNDEMAVVDIATHVTDSERPELIYTRITLLWDGERWQVDPTMQMGSPNQQIGDLDGFVDWDRIPD